MEISQNNNKRTSDFVGIYALSIKNLIKPQEIYMTLPFKHNLFVG